VLVLELSAFALTAWLGLYLLGRNPANPQMRLAALGALAYALALAGETLGAALARAGTPLASWLAAWLAPWRWPVLGLPAIFWAGALVALGRAGPGARPRGPLAAVAVATLFFGLGLGLIIFPLNWLPRGWALLAISVDLAALGLAIAGLDAFAEGEALRPEMARSFLASAAAVLVFAAPVALVITTSTGPTPPMLALLFGLAAAAIAGQVFADPVQAGLDRLAFFQAPRLRRERADLRAVASALPRADTGQDPAALDEAEFGRQTRRALSHMQDLARLSASPLARLPVITARLAARGARDDSLERAQELRALLAESIQRLKPRGAAAFGTSDEWRHYNAVYFPYVVGLRPYARRADAEPLGADAQSALDWFRASVPERTLYNWQNAAARLIAQDLRGRPET